MLLSWSPALLGKGTEGERKLPNLRSSVKSPVFSFELGQEHASALSVQNALPRLGKTWVHDLPYQLCNRQTAGNMDPIDSGMLIGLLFQLCFAKYHSA